MYSIRWEYTRRLIHVVLSGFMSLEEAAAYAREREDLVANKNLQADSYFLLVDISDFPIQDKDVVEFFRRFAETQSVRPRRMVFLSTTVLPRMQARRVFSGMGHISLAETVGDAHAYLFEGKALPGAR